MRVGRDMNDVVFDEATRELLDGKNFATVATLMPDGAPHTSVVWFGREGDTVVFSTLAGRRKARNLARDPRVSVSIVDAANPYRAVDIRGRAELVDDPERALGQRLTQAYLGQDAPPDPPGARRLIVRIHPERVTRFGL
jgi:PPOX class probable F420-dependent enzyme